MSLSMIDTMLGMTVRMATPFLFAALAGLLSQRSGVHNFALEGIMLGGAYFGYLAALKSGSLAVGLVCAIVFGLAAGLFLAVTALHFGANQLVTGLAMCTLFQGLTSFLDRLFSKTGDGVVTLDHLMTGIIGGKAAEIPILGSLICSQNLMTFLAVALFVFYAWFIRHTDIGLGLKAVGEDPVTAETAGIPVFRYRYLAVTISGALAALGGAYLTLTHVNRFAENMTNGRGWVAISAICLGRWTPLGTFLSCLLFGLANAVSNQIQVLDTVIPTQVALMTPYILSIIALVSVRGKLGGRPAALGKPYLKEY